MMSFKVNWMCIQSTELAISVGWTIATNEIVNRALSGKDKRLFHIDVRQTLSSAGSDRLVRTRPDTCVDSERLGTPAAVLPPLGPPTRGMLIYAPRIIVIRSMTKLLPPSSRQARSSPFGSCTSVPHGWPAQNWHPSQKSVGVHTLANTALINLVL